MALAHDDVCLYRLPNVFYVPLAYTCVYKHTRAHTWIIAYSYLPALFAPPAVWKGEIKKNLSKLSKCFIFLHHSIRAVLWRTCDKKQTEIYNPISVSWCNFLSQYLNFPQLQKSAKGEKEQCEIILRTGWDDHCSSSDKPSSFWESSFCCWTRASWDFCQQ